MFKKNENTAVNSAPQNRGAEVDKTQPENSGAKDGVADADTAAAAHNAANQRASDNGDAEVKGNERKTASEVVIPAEHSATNGAETVTPGAVLTADQQAPFDPAAHQRKADEARVQKPELAGDTLDGGNKNA